MPRVSRVMVWQNHRPQRPSRTNIRNTPYHVTIVLLGLQVGGLAQDSAPPQNPLTGIAADGRIPKVQLPEDLNHPERWRYFPEGRLMEGDVFERFLVSSFFSPILFREADVGTGGGVAITDLDFRNQRRREFANMVVT